MSEEDNEEVCPAISVIVVSYNTRSMTLECLRSVIDETRTPYELIVVDNASSDGSADAIASEFPKLRLIVEADNHGFSAANNIAAKTAVSEYVLLLNPDTVVLDGAIDALFRFAQSNTQAKIWGGRTLYGDRRLNPTNCWRRMSIWGLTSQVLGLNSIFRESAFFNPEGYGGWKRDCEREVDIVTGCFLLIEREFWEALGGFDPLFVMYGEEADLCLRAQKMGARPMVTPNATIVHYMGASEKIRSDKLVRLLRAKITLIERHFSVLQKPFGKLLLSLWPLSRYFGASLMRRSDAQDNWREVWARRKEWIEGYAAKNGPPNKTF